VDKRTGRDILYYAVEANAEKVVEYILKNKLCNMFCMNKEGKCSLDIIREKKLINLATLYAYFIIDNQELKRFLKITGHIPKIINVPITEATF
jgi:hypothetical protein